MTTPEPVDRHTELLSGTVLTVFRLHGQLLSVAEEIARPAGLTAARWQVLGSVFAEAMTVSEVARRHGTARQSVQRVADALVAHGLAEYLPNPSHSRARLLSPTEEGRATLRRLRQDQTLVADAFVDEFGENHARRVLDSLAELSRALERVHDHGRPSMEPRDRPPWRGPVTSKPHDPQKEPFPKTEQE